jgi:hypothetical protein
MIIRVVGQSGEPVFPFNTSGPWVKFKDTLLIDKNLLVTEKFGQKIDALICHGYSKSAITEAKKSKVPKDRMILVLWEPPITHPKLYSDDYLSRFGYVYAPSKEWAKNYNPIYFNWPVGVSKSKFKKTNFKNRRNNAVIIQGNKVNFFKGENYSLRRIVLFKSLALKYPIILYGKDWRRFSIKQIFKSFVKFLLNWKYGFSLNALQYIKAKYPYYKGISKDKFNTLEKYKICIVIENHNSYVSEKIFDSLNSNCITIYVGPSLTDYGLNRNLAIQSDPESESILNTIEDIMKLNNKEMLEILKTQRYCLEKVLREWNNEIVLTKLAKNISHNLKK